MELLEHESEGAVAYIRQCIVIELLHRLAVQPVTAAGGTIQAAQDVHGGALAGAAGSHHGEIVPAVDGEIELIKGSNRQVTGSIHLADVDQFGDR